MPDDGHQQAYDHTLKGLFEAFALYLLPLLFEGITVIEPLNVERLIPPKRVDRVFTVWFRNKMHILHLEFETSNTSKEMMTRLLTYHALLHVARAEARARAEAEAEAERAKVEAELAKAEAELRAKAEALRSSVVAVVEALYPELSLAARESVPHLHNTLELSRLIKQVASAPDKKTAAWVLQTFAA